MLTVRDIEQHLHERAPWVDWRRTCDGLKTGDLDMPVHGIAVGWQSSQAAIEQAHEMGCNLFITHEPTFYSHMDDRKDWLATPAARRKRAFLANAGMSVYRCHDAWDVFPGLGVVDAWGAFLELGEPVASQGYYRLYEIPAMAAWEFAHRIAQTVASLGEQSVDFFGRKWQTVSRVAIGTGAITDVRTMQAMGADVLVTSNDGTIYWRDASWVSDSGLPMVVVDHQTSEMPGMRNLVAYLEEHFTVPCHLTGGSCTHEVFATQKGREIPVRMKRTSMEDLPPVELPEGYTLRSMIEDEVWAYLQVMNRSIYQGEADDRWFERTFSSDPLYDPSFVQIIWRGQVPVAAAAAWHGVGKDEGWGVVHFVGADPDERGHGLGRAIVAATLHRIRDRGFDRALLGTQSWRMAAITTYQRLGFEPWPDTTGTVQVWGQIKRDLEDWRAIGRPRMSDELLDS